MENVFAIFIGVCLGHIVVKGFPVLIELIKEKLNKNK